MEGKKPSRGSLGWVGEIVTAFLLLHGLGNAQIPLVAVRQNTQERLLVDKSDTLPFTLIDGYLIVVEGRIGAHRHLRLVLDTGSTHSVLRSDFPGVQTSVRRPVRIINLEKVVKQELAEVQDFELGPLCISRLPIMLHDLNYLRKPLPGLDGVIGLDVLRTRSFSIDFRRRRIAFGASPTLRNSANMENKDVYLAVGVGILNRPVRLVLDTGIRAILLYRDRMGSRLPALRVEEHIQGASLSGAASLQLVDLPRMQLSGTYLNPRAVLLQHSPAGLLPQLDGYLSLKALGAQRFNFDFEKSIFSWE